MWAPNRPQQTRATQTIPPRVRRQIMRRDRGRCVVPGCRHTQFVDVHHVRCRADGGDHDPDNLVVLCAAHHRAAHAGQLCIVGRVSAGLVFRHADGASYGQPTAPTAVDTKTKLFAALRTMGFGEGETRRALAELRGPLEANLQTLLREALAILTGHA